MQCHAYLLGYFIGAKLISFISSNCVFPAMTRPNTSSEKRFAVSRIANLFMNVKASQSMFIEKKIYKCSKITFIQLFMYTCVVSLVLSIHFYPSIYPNLL